VQLELQERQAVEVPWARQARGVLPEPQDGQELVTPMESQVVLAMGKHRAHSLLLTMHK